MPDDLGQALGEQWAHICVDMQNMFSKDTDWHTPWLDLTLPVIEAISAQAATRTIFTRFVPPETVEDAHGAWKDYYRRWSSMTRSQLPPDMIELVPTLARLVPPARIFDKTGYSPWTSGELHRLLRSSRITTLLITGGESDVCVLATVLGAFDLGYRVVVPVDAVFGSADATHDAILEIYRSRFQCQLTVTSTDELLTLWRDKA